MFKAIRTILYYTIYIYHSLLMAAATYMLPEAGRRLDHKPWFVATFVWNMEVCTEIWGLGPIRKSRACLGQEGQSEGSLGLAEQVVEEGPRAHGVLLRRTLDCDGWCLYQGGCATVRPCSTPCKEETRPQPIGYQAKHQVLITNGGLLGEAIRSNLVYSLRIQLQSNLRRS